MSEESLFTFLVPVVHHYAWGCKGNTSLVGRVWKQTQLQTLCKQEVIEVSKPYAELWYGSHPNGMNMAKTENGEIITLSEFIKNHEQYHTRCTSSKENQLPYLLKVLCNDIALSIQCHPDKATARHLHSEQPNIYKDPNHKPEISLALSDQVEAMCGFRPWDEIADAINHIAEIGSLLGPNWLTIHYHALQNPTNLSDDDVTRCLRSTFEGLMKSDTIRVNKCLKELSENCQSYLSNTKLSGTLKDALKVFSQLNKDFPGDAGCLAAFLLNHVITKPGECMFIPANVLHAYLKGQIIECMACSDNVVRGGLTPKFCDMDLLLQILDYSAYRAPLIAPQSLPISANANNLPLPRLLLYDPHVGDFRLYLVYVPMGSNISSPISFFGDSAAVLLVLQGKAEINIECGDGSKKSTGPIVQGHSLLLALDSKITVVHSNATPIEKPQHRSITPPIDFNEILEGKQDDADFIAVVAIGGATAMKFLFTVSVVDMQFEMDYPPPPFIPTTPLPQALVPKNLVQWAKTNPSALFPLHGCTYMCSRPASQPLYQPQLLSISFPPVPIGTTATQQSSPSKPTLLIVQNYSHNGNTILVG